MSDSPPNADSPATPPVMGVIDGFAGRRTSNALALTLVQDGMTAPLGRAQQGAGDGAGKKLGILFGLKNYDAGRHVLTYTDAAAGTLVVGTQRRGPTQVTRGDGTAVATITRGDETTVAALPDGSTLLTFGPDPVAQVTDARYRLAVTDAGGVLMATLDLVRADEGFDNEALGDYVLGGLTGQGWSVVNTETGGSMPNLFKGTRLVMFREPTPDEREVLLAAIVELGLSARCYTPAMGRGVAWG